MKKQKITKQEFIASISNQTDEQWEECQKVFNREVSKIIKYEHGEIEHTLASFELEFNLINLQSIIDDLEHFIFEHPEDIEAAAKHLEIKLELDALWSDFENKVDSFCAIVKQYELESDKMKSMASLYLKKAEKAETNAERVKSRIREFLQNQSLEKVDGEFFKVKLNKPTFSVLTSEWDSDYLKQLVIDGKLKNEYVREEFKINKTEVKKDLLNNVEIFGCTLLQKQSLSIK